MKIFSRGSESTLIIVSAIMAVACWARHKLPKPFGNLLWFLLLPVYGLVLYFFRDPERDIPTSDTDLLVLSPADGSVVDIQVVDEPIFIQGQALRISIFMSILDVHVNRSPVPGTVRLTKHVPGKFLQAYRQQASEVNEHHLLGIQVEESGGYRGRVLVKQIAGILARRCVCYATVGERLAGGQRFGLIRFSSRVDLFLPTHVRCNVDVGDQVCGASSILAYWLPREEHS
ncbi:MAG: phosphatidylserine decarboxylase family protein [Anaerolineales bacterium]|nr:phosphatidylserine decarboxylase family protein [Anaerolineales bacterium]